MRKVYDMVQKRKLREGEVMTVGLGRPTRREKAVEMLSRGSCCLMCLTLIICFPDLVDMSLTSACKVLGAAGEMKMRAESLA